MNELEDRAGVLVVLHGHGDEPASAGAWGRRIAPAGWEVVAPGAPHGPGGERSWFPTGPRGADVEALERSTRRITDLVREAGAGGRPVVVVGFSQGGAVALSLGAASRHAEGAGPTVVPDGVVSVCGFLPEVADGDVDLVGDGTAGPPALLVAGSDDEVVPPFLSTDAAAALSAHGRRVSAEVVPGGHEVGDAAVDLVRGWIGELIRRTIRVSVGLPVDRIDAGVDLVSGDAIVTLAAAYERYGFHAAYVTDHPAPDDRWLAGGGHHTLEPTVALATAAAATRRLLVHTNVYVLPYRNPFLAAKALASLDVVSSGRLIAGVAAGYLRPEFRALGAAFDDRTDRLEDALELLPLVWSGDAIVRSGTDYDATSVTALPRPLQVPHPPIWVGGNSRAAMRRAATLAQGWSPFPTPGGMETAVRTSAISDLADLRRSLRSLAELCAEIGRIEPLTICFSPFSLQRYLDDPDTGLTPLVEEVAEMEDLGVDWVTLAVPGRTRSEVVERAELLGEALHLRSGGSPPRW